MNPLRWRREYQVAGTAFCISGALAGLIYGWLDSPFNRICHAPAGFAKCPEMLLMWLQYPSQYWLLMLVGAVVPGLVFYGAIVLREIERR